MTTPPQSPSLIRFGSYEADLLSGELRKSGIRLKIQGRPFQILSILLEQPGKVVTREHIQKRLWPEDTFVDFEHGLNTAINKLRQVLSDDPENPRFIETLPKRGYRFIAPVAPIAALPSPLLTPNSPELSSPANAQSPSDPAPSDFPAATRRHAALYLAALGLAFLGIALLIWWQFAARNRAAQWSEIRIAPLNGLPREGDASFSPDGNQVAFVWGGEKGKAARIYVSQIGAADSPRRLSDAGEGSYEFVPVWSPDGRYIAFYRYSESDNSLGIVVTAALGGSERRLYTVKSPSKIDALDWSADGKFLAFSDSPSADSASSICLLSLDTLQVHAITSPPAGTLGDSSPAFSPDGKYLAFVRNTLDVQEMFRMPASGGTPTQITFDHVGIQGIAWTPDSSELIFSSSRQGQPSLWRISAQGGSPQRLPIAGAGWAVRPAVSRKGNRLAYSSVQFSASIWRASLSSDRKVSEPFERLISSTALEEGPQFSPDGKRLVFQSTRTGYSEIWRANADASSPVQLTHFSANLTGTPRWSPDSQQIAFDSRPGGHSQIFIINAEGGQPRQVTQGDFDSAVPSWSVDGKWIFFASNRSGTWQVWKISPEGNSPAQITRHGGFAALPSFDGKYLYYAKGRQLAGLWRVPVDGGEEISVIDSMPPASWGYFAVTREGIYFPDVPTPETAGLFFYEFQSGKRTLAIGLGNHEHEPEAGAPALAVSPDNKSMLICFQDPALAYIMLVENFRP